MQVNFTPIDASQPLNSIKVFAISQEDSDRKVEVVQRCAATLLEHHPFLSFDALDSLVIGHDYLDAMRLYEADGPPDYIHKTKHSWSHVLPTQAGIAVIIHPQILQWLQDENGVDRLKGMRVLRHELCHLHDLGLQRVWLMRHAQGKGDFSRSFRVCFPLWAEYFANRYSYFEGAYQDIDWLRLDQLLIHFQQLDAPYAVQQTVARFGCVLGSLAGQGVELQDVRPDLVPPLHASGLWDAWSAAKVITAQLAVNGDCWASEAGVMQLQPVVERIQTACRNRGITRWT